MYTDPADWPEGNLHGFVFSDYVGSEVMDGIAPDGLENLTTFMPGRDLGGDTYAGFGDRPSRAWLRTSRQFMLIKAHGTAVALSAFGLARTLIIETERLIHRYGGGRDQLLVRGLELSRPGKAILYVDLMYTPNLASPHLMVQTIQTYLERQTWYLGGTTMKLTCKIQIGVREGDLNDPLDDRYYERVRAAMFW